MSIGKNIRRIRKEKGLTQKKLGELSGINEVQIRQYELERATPKIGTVDKIATALEVNIIDIMEQFSMEQYKTTSEFKSLEKDVAALKGVIAILEDIYGKVEDKSIYGKYGEGHYYLVGEGKEQFVLYDCDLDNLCAVTKAMLPFMVNEMKDTRPEKEIIKDYMKDIEAIETELLDEYTKKD